jgi:parallel beta-helix repeat protein
MTCGIFTVDKLKSTIKKGVMMTAKHMRSCLQKLFLLAVLVVLTHGTGYAFTLGDVDQSGTVKVNEAVYALQVSSGVRNTLSVTTITVPGDFSTIQKAVDAANEGDTIKVAAGTYNENIFIRKDHIIIEGDSRDTTIINAKDTAAETLKIYNCTNVTINDVQIKGGIIGIKAHSADVYINDSLVQENAIGIKGQFNSTLIIDNSLVKNNTDKGLQFSFGASFYAYGMQVTGNAHIGIDISKNANGMIESCKISDNGEMGISASNSGSIHIEGSELSANGFGVSYAASGISVSHSARADIRSGTIISSNNGYGIDVTHNAGARIDSVKITDNGVGDQYAGGVGIYHAGYMNIKSSEIYSNKGPGVDMTGGSTLKAEKNTRIHSNDMDGVGVYNSSNARFYSGVSITNNAGFGIQAGMFGEVTKADVNFGDDTHEDQSYHKNKDGDKNGF